MYRPRFSNGKNSFAYGVGAGVNLGASIAIGKMAGIAIFFGGLFALALWPITLPCLLFYLIFKDDKKEKIIEEPQEEKKYVNEAYEAYKKGCIEKGTWLLDDVEKKEVKNEKTIQ